MLLKREPGEWPVGAYDLILADPPWPYRDRSRNRGGAERHYPTMSEAEIQALPVASLGAANAVLFLWATGPNLPMAMRTMAAWGFNYKVVAFAWLKSNADGTLYMGMGHYTRSNAEFCLLGIRGKGLPRRDKSVRMAQIHPRRAHSAKPFAFYHEIERLYGSGVRRVELFARVDQTDMAALNWDFWGADLFEAVESGNE